MRPVYSACAAAHAIVIGSSSPVVHRPIRSAKPGASLRQTLNRFLCQWLKTCFVWFVFTTNMTTNNAKGETGKVEYESLRTVVFVENDSNDYLDAREQLAKLKLCNPIHRSHNVAGLMQYLERLQKNALKDPASLPCVILMELKLPITGGLDGQAMVRSSLHFRSIPIIAISGTDRLNALQHAVTLGANGFLVKPLEAGTFRKLAEELRLPLVYGSAPRKVVQPPVTNLPIPKQKIPSKKENLSLSIARKLGLFSF